VEDMEIEAEMIEEEVMKTEEEEVMKTEEEVGAITIAPEKEAAQEIEDTLDLIVEMTDIIVNVAFPFQ
jgi:superfamily II DNA/RNA helicase